MSNTSKTSTDGEGCDDDDDDDDADAEDVDDITIRGLMTSQPPSNRTYSMACW